MKAISLKHLVESTSGQLCRGTEDELIVAISTDSRSIPEGGAFFALKGENFDAHDFLEKAVFTGAKVLVVERLPDGIEIGSAAVVLVDDVLKALQDVAAWYRSQLNIKVVGITGSNGKTSTKDFTRDMLGVSFRVSATQGNLNNHIGLPLSVLSTEEEDEVCVWEMGMNHPGEIAPLCEIAKPDIGIITNIGTAHIEFMGSRDAIALEKGELGRSLPRQGALFVPTACDYSETLKGRTEADTILVGGEGSSVRAENIVISSGRSCFDLVVDGLGRAEVQLPVMGKHMVNNALLAAAVGVRLNMNLADIVKGLSLTHLTSGRLRVFECRGVSVFDDTYNANLESVSAGIETLAEVEASGKKYAVLGRMAELGRHTEAAHQAVGKLAAQKQICLISVGDQAEQITAGAKTAGGDARHFPSVESAAEWLRAACLSGDVVLFKGSRAAGMERVMNQVFSNQ